MARVSTKPWGRDAWRHDVFAAEAPKWRRDFTDCLCIVSVEGPCPKACLSPAPFPALAISWGRGGFDTSRCIVLGSLEVCLRHDLSIAVLVSSAPRLGPQRIAVTPAECAKKGRCKVSLHLAMWVCACVRTCIRTCMMLLLLRYCYGGYYKCSGAME